MRQRKKRVGGLAVLAASVIFTALVSGGFSYRISQSDQSQSRNDSQQADLDRRLQVLETKLDGAIAMLNHPVASTEVRSGQRKGWHVRAFQPPEPANYLANLRKSNDSGSFVHTGSWINMLQHREHEGIYLPADAAFNIRGQFVPNKTGDHVFAVHMAYAGGKGQRQVQTIGCHVNVKIAGQAPVVAGKLKADSLIHNATLVAPIKIFLSAGRPELVDALIACDLPVGVSGKNVAFRICVRHESETGFRPVPAYLPEA
ncbi:MAG: hypothetical protein HOJ06_09215 [Rhodospirillaceae bacterium]|nr:hypothetical protein [Rhodospirillaceae bacterium]